jgi:hypothetical protein
VAGAPARFLMLKTRFILPLLSLASLVSLRAAAPTVLPAREKDALMKEVRIVQKALESGEADPIIKKTHPAILKLFQGSQENFENTTRHVLVQMEKQGVKIESLTVGEPTAAYTAGDEQICFVPTTTVVSMNGQRAKSTAFLIAARKTPIGQWLFLDAASLRNNPELLATLFPALPKDVQTPPISVEKL